MSSSKLDTSGVFHLSQAQPQKAAITVPVKGLRVSRNGIEFRSAEPVRSWSEMRVQFESPVDSRKVECIGVVVACQGNRHTGFVVSMVLTHASPQAARRLAEIEAATVI